MNTIESSIKVLFVGESWIKHTIHMKGFDQFHSTEYEEGAGFFLGCLDDAGFDVTYIRGHEITLEVPRTAEEIDEFDVVIISDIGSNSFLLPDETFLRSERSPNRLGLVADYVERGGGLLMVGGYMSFTGIDAKGRFGMSPLAEPLPVTMLNHDDRVEMSEGAQVEVCDPGHPVLGGTPAEWPPPPRLQQADRQARRHGGGAGGRGPDARRRGATESAAPLPSPRTLRRTGHPRSS